MEGLWWENGVGWKPNGNETLPSTAESCIWQSLDGWCILIVLCNFCSGLFYGLFLASYEERLFLLLWCSAFAFCLVILHCWGSDGISELDLEDANDGHK